MDKVMTFMKVGMFVVLAIAAPTVMSSPEIPKDSKVLGVTKSKKPVRTGLVFIDGKYIKPPYKVERWGVGIKINGIPVVGQVVEWNEFLKTQAGVKVEKKIEMPGGEEVAATEAKPPEPKPEEKPEPSPAASSDDDDDSSLDDLFDDDPPAKKKKPVKASAPKPVFKPKPKKPVEVMVYTLEGPFQANETTKGYVKRINAARADIDAQLRMGKFFCFGDNYARVSGDERTAMQMLEKLPEIMRTCESEQAFCTAVRNANMLYLNENVCRDLFLNRVDYRQLQERLEKWKKDQELNKMLNDGVNGQLF